MRRGGGGRLISREGGGGDLEMFFRIIFKINLLLLATREQVVGDCDKIHVSVIFSGLFHLQTFK